MLTACTFRAFLLERENEALGKFSIITYHKCKHQYLYMKPLMISHPSLVLIIHSDVLGWGRNISGRILDFQANALTEIIRPRINGYTCKLDVYEVGINTYEGGYIKPVSKNMKATEGAPAHSCLMINYFSLGVQGEFSNN